MPSADYLAIAEAAEVVGVGKRTMERWVARGVVPVVRVGRVVRIRRADLAHVLAPRPARPRRPTRGKG